MTKSEMMNIVYNQLAVDYNCKSDDFTKDGVNIYNSGKAKR